MEVEGSDSSIQQGVVAALCVQKEEPRPIGQWHRNQLVECRYGSAATSRPLLFSHPRLRGLRAFTEVSRQLRGLPWSGCLPLPRPQLHQ